MTCQTCGFTNPGGMRFCGQCGAGLPRACPRCAAEMPGEYRFCGTCGTPLGAQNPALAPSATRQMTVFFADISGFTSLAERLTPTELQDTMDRVGRDSGRDPQ